MTELIVPLARGGKCSTAATPAGEFAPTQGQHQWFEYLAAETDP